MRKKSHWRLADYLMGDNEKPAIELMFKVGSVAPDFMLRSMIQGHSYDTTSHRVHRRIIKLEERGRWNLISAYRLGYVTHYLADYFTAPHNMHGEFGFKAHCSFEKQQLHMLRGQLNQQRELSKEYNEELDIMEYLDALHEEYMAQSPEVERDCDYIVNVTEQVVDHMFMLFNERQQKPEAKSWRHRLSA